MKQIPDIFKMKTFVVCTALMLANWVHAEKDTNGFWPENKRAAVCLTYDDGLDCHLDVVVPALERYEMKGTFNVPGNSDSLNRRLQEWRTIAENGHEIGNHTLFHPCDAKWGSWVKPEYSLTTYTLSQIRDELRVANTLLQAVDGNRKRTYAYTCGDCTVEDGVLFSDQIGDLFVSARGSGPIPKTIEEINPFYMPSTVAEEMSGEVLIGYVQKAIENGTMVVFMFHSVGGGYINISSEAHEALLSYLNDNKDVIWVDTFLSVSNYLISHQIEK